MSLRNEYRRDYDRRMSQRTSFWLALALLVVIVVGCAIFL